MEPGRLWLFLGSVPIGLVVPLFFLLSEEAYLVESILLYLQESQELPSITCGVDLE